ncbi:bifunctional 4-alpha-glucanotransferase/amylo-alpha-1,6-glucosidase [Basidiobolus ranarum]|uniref:Bifunctional 4-alpha-glucanotransferase/amylo-alpha-1,6-glucosidase n=1 Tax=Basidiobolus ranarum TaxID=34480 RepID=A0ABR2VQJ0_9FUNG
MDCTHDNETPNQKRMAEDTLPNAALVAMSSCSVGSVKGYDEIYPRLLDLVGENRRYEKLEDPLNTGIGKSKKILQELHQQMAEEGYKEVHVHHENQYVMVHRQHPDTHDGYFMIAHTAFANSEERSWVAPVKLRGTKAEVIFCHRLVVKNRKPEQNNEYLTGLETILEELPAPQLVEGSDDHGAYTEVVFPENFTRGSVMLMKTSLTSTPAGIHEKLSSGIREAVSKLGLLEINVALYRCDQEERDVLKDDGTYNVPNYGQLPYSGLEGFMSVLKPIMKNSDLGHPFCGHLREGQWVLDYIVSRLDKYSDHYPLLKDLSHWFKQKFEIIRQFPNFLLPKYFASVLHTAYDACRDRAVEHMSPFVRDGDDFIKSLALTSVQMYGVVDTTSLHPTKPGPCLAAGLPHFSVRHMRCWGRDVFIALRGLMMVTGNFEGAKEHILAFAGSLKHGQIPNLLDSLRKPRYNARDSTWWFLQAIQDYCNLAPNGIELLKESVPRRFPKTDEFVESDDPLAYSYNSTIIEIIQEILERHANGIHFREWNAGHNLDQSMSHEGFQVDITTDWKTGLIHGGSQYNCGTWMDKMGESPRAGTVGVPATPRDGATIEIIALLKSTLRWILNLSASGKYPHKGVQIQDSGKVITFRHWNDLIQKSFEEHFYVPLEETEDAQYKIDSNLVKRRGIYKDTYGSSKKYTDYDFRPNFSIAIIVAPELFNPKHALSALEKARETLMGPLGMRTLDPADNEYRGDYENGNDSDDRSVARGFNYHQGPEWVWIFGYYLKAYFTYKLKNTKEDVNELIYTILRDLIPHKKEIETSKWAGIPELTNSNGSFCAGSCPTQAWSTGSLLDVLRELALSAKN